jgi:hypothetical protein
MSSDTNYTLQFNDDDGTITNDNGKITCGQEIFHQSGTQLLVPNVKIEVKKPIHGQGVLSLGTADNQLHLHGYDIFVKGYTTFESSFIRFPSTGILVGGTILTEANLIALKALLS